MPKELDERIGPTTAQSETPQSTTRHPAFRARVIPATPLFIFGMFATLASVYVTYMMVLEVRSTWADIGWEWPPFTYVVWRLFPCSLSVASSACTLIAGVACWNGKWKWMILTLMLAGAGTTTAYFLDYFMIRYSTTWL